MDGSRQPSFLESRYLVWFSCGAASACAAKLATDALTAFEAIEGEANDK